MKYIFLILAICTSTMRLSAKSNAPVSAQPVSASKMSPLRIALMDFVSDDNSYRSTVALENLVSALQVEISGDTNYDWVERAELEKATQELKLAGFGLIDRSEAIRSGHWVKADWGIYGNISTNFNGHQTLSLEIVNLRRADVLAETNLLLSSTDSGPFQMKSEYVSQIASSMGTLLNHAHEIYLASEKQDTVAFLFLSVKQNGPDEAVGNLDADFRRSLLMESTSSHQFHLVQFQRAGVAMDEASLILSGLAETDSNSWQKVADHYIWGSVRIDVQKIFDWKTKDWRDERKVDVKLNVWDGRGETQIITLTTTNETSEGLARELTQRIEPLLRRDETKPIIEKVRTQISDSIFAQYSGLPVNFSFDSPEGRQQWFDAVQLLETACFFNPGNAAAREQLIRLRWGTSLPGYNAGSPTATEELGRLSLTYGLKSASRNEFFFARRRSEAWGKYVEQFGPTTALPKPNSPGIAAEYVLSAWRPFEMFSFAQENQAEWGIPRDAGLREANEWKNQFGSEFISRLLKAPDQYNERYNEALQSYFKGIDQPGGEQKLLAQLKAVNAGKNGEPANSPPPMQPVRLPRIAELGSSQTEDIFSMRSMMFPPPPVESDVQTISFPPGVRVKGIKSMVFHDAALWLTVEVAEPLEVKSVSGQIEKEFQAVLVDHVRLWKLESNTKKLEPVTGMLATNDISKMTFQGDTLWLALKDSRIVTLNVRTGELQHHESPDAAIPTNALASANVLREITAIAGRAALDRIGYIRSAASDGSGTFWIAGDSGLHSVNANTGKIRSQWIPVSPTIQVTESDAHFGQGQPYKTDSQLVKQVLQKLEFRQQLLDAGKTQSNQPNLFIPNSRLTAGILSVTTDDDFLWVFTKETARPLLYHSASQSWVGGFSVNHMGTPSALACGNGKLWLATRLGEDCSILEIDARKLKTIPHERWLPDVISEEELASRISDMPEHERAIYFFFSGNDAAAVKLLQTSTDDKHEAESLFMLRSCFLEMGDSNQASHVERQLTQKFPDSIFVKVLSSNQRNKEARAQIEARFRTNPRPGSNTANDVSAWMMRNCDADGDGALDESELAVYFELEPDQLPAPVFNSSLKPAAAAAEFLRRYDRNRDDRLQDNELTAAMAERHFFTGRPAVPRTNRLVLDKTQTTNP